MDFASAYKPHVIPERAEMLGEGIWRWENAGSCVVLPTFWSDPTKASEEWLDAQRKGSTLSGFDREVLISFESWDGKPVYREYNEQLHLSRKPLVHNPNDLIIVGIDIPGPPAAVWIQLQPVRMMREILGFRLNVLAELIMDCSIDDFGRGILDMNQQRFPTAKKIKYVADPAAFYEITGTKRSASQILKEFCGIYLTPGPVNLVDRIEPVKRWLKRMVPVAQAGESPAAVQIAPDCVYVRDGFRGGYYYKAHASTGSFKESPEKNESSHPMNGLEYAVWAARPPDEKKEEKLKPLVRDPNTVVAALE